MQMQVGEAGEGVLNVALDGRLDMPGVDQIGTQFTAQLVPRSARAIVDLSNVVFLASGGIRLFISVARALAKKGGILVLYGAQPMVAEVLAATSVNDIVPVRPDAVAALAAVRG
jgi:anti-sigma B factor antagonist